ncbi:MAG: hypothetical protein RPR40_12275, partial [Bermanella sp.]
MTDNLKENGFITTCSENRTNSFIILGSDVPHMPAERKRLAGGLVLLMLLAPIAAAANANWAGPNSVNPQGGDVTLTGFRVPGNAKIGR